MNHFTDAESDLRHGGIYSSALRRAGDTADAIAGRA
jgi:broad specificity phosphatase PhoE